MKKISFFVLCLLLCIMTACGGTDVVTTTAQTTTQNGNPPVVSFTKDPNLHLDPSEVPTGKERQEWRVEVALVSLERNHLVMAIRDLDNLGFWCYQVYYGFERQEEDGSWTKLVTATEPPEYDRYIFVNPHPEGSGTATYEHTAYFAEEWGKPLLPGVYRFTKTLFYDGESYAAQLEFTVNE